MKKRNPIPETSGNADPRPGKREKRGPIPDTILSTPLFRLLAMLSTAMTVWIVAHIVMPYHEGLLLLTFPLTAAGYGLQLLIQKITPPKNPDKISFHRGIPGLLISAIFCLLIASPIYNQLANGLLPNLYFESDYSSWMIFTVGFIFLVLLTGVYTAMVPPGRFFSYNSAYTFAGIYLIIWILSFFSPSFHTVILILPAFLITVFFLFAMNQSGIDELGRRARVMGVTAELRTQNFRLTAMMILLFAGIFFLSLVVFTGIYYVFKFLGWVLLRFLFSKSSDSSGDVVPHTSDFFSGGFFDLPEVNRFLFLNFVILVVLLLAALFVRIYNYRSGIRLRDIPGKLIELIRRLLAFLERLFRQHREPVTRYSVRQPYQDTVTIAAPSAYRSAARSYDDYLHRMKVLADEKERLCFAYGTLIALWRKLSPGKPNALPPAMTPREICAKLAEEGRYNFEQVTELYELIRYAELPVYDENIARITERLSGYVQQYFNTL